MLTLLLTAGIAGGGGNFWAYKSPEFRRPPTTVYDASWRSPPSVWWPGSRRPS